MSEFDGAHWAQARASSTNSSGTGFWGKNIRVEKTTSDRIIKVQHDDISLSAGNYRRRIVQFLSTLES